MDSSITLVLIGGLISLVSTLSGLILKHWLEMKKIATEVKHHPAQVIYNKQTEFFDRLAPILLGINSYITEIDVWLWEKSEDAEKQVKRAAANNQALTEFHELLEHYYMYLPQDLIERANQLHSECMHLSTKPSHKLTEICLDRLFSFQNSIRRHVGIETLSQDLLKAFSSQPKEAHKN